jgi:hypothetical protein
MTLKSCLLAAALAAALPTAALAQAAGQDADAKAKAAMNTAAEALQPEAKAAIEKMGAYLRTLTSFEVVAEGYSEEVLDNGQKITFPGKLTYQVMLPNKLFAEISNDRKQRRLYFNGDKVTVYAPRVNYFADFDFKGTIREMMAAADDKYSIDFPLQDLFLWGKPETPMPTSGFYVGPEKVGDVKVDHYAFRQPGVDWQVWIAQGDKPLPMRIVMTNTDDDSRPQYGVRLAWQPDLTITSDRFTFVPNDKAARIKIDPNPRETAQ